MKVFLSWSGDTSHKIAIILRDWLPSVIQSIEPYVSSEDIDKGARWSTDIAKELENSSFGILCVTGDNIETPWLNFEAGALSKTMDKSYVTPFLFGIKRSDVKGPILQFQSTVFERDDIKKLINTMNKACCDMALPEDRLNKTFDVWYPPLESQLNEISSAPKLQDESIKKANSDEILEEILNISRINHKILRANDKDSDVNILELKKQLDELLAKRTSITEVSYNNTRKKFHPIMFEEFTHYAFMKDCNYISISILLAYFRNDFPWLYEAGSEAISLLKQAKTISEKEIIISNLDEILDLTARHPFFREMDNFDSDYRMFGKDISKVLVRSLRNVALKSYKS